LLDKGQDFSPYQSNPCAKTFRLIFLMLTDLNKTIWPGFRFCNWEIIQLVRNKYGREKEKFSHWGIFLQISFKISILNLVDVSTCRDEPTSWDLDLVLA